MSKEQQHNLKMIEAKVGFLSDRTCCVCREKGKPYQIHHIENNHNNNDIDNLASLCLLCHNETQVTGGFGRKLNNELEVLKYKHPSIYQKRIVIPGSNNIIYILQKGVNP